MKKCFIFSWLVMLAGVFCITTDSFAAKCHSSEADYQSTVMGQCGERVLPPHKTRRARNIHLECSSGVDHYIRRPVPFDYDEWIEMENTHNQDRMQNFRQKEPLIQWSGTVGYTTHEIWDWTKCEWGEDESACGSHQECHEEDDEECDTQNHCHTVTKTVCEKVINSCWHDEEVHEQRHCSNEMLTYSAEFSRPVLAEWNPKTPGYYDVIPNKYDLLPGELEDVQFYSSGGLSPKIQPSIQIGDAWNEYSNSIQFDEPGTSENGRSEVACLYHHTHNAHAVIYTNKRLIKRTPNAFHAPVDEEGKPLDPIADWDLATVGPKSVRQRPAKVKLADASADIITAMARQSRKFEAKKEKAEFEMGKNQNATAKAQQEMQNNAKGGFWKNTQVRVRLSQIVKWGRDIYPAHTLKTDGSQVAHEEFYKIPLSESDSSRNLYYTSGPWFPKFWERFELKLKPDTSYRLLISMYQESVPFYEQDCTGKKTFCSEGHYFSNELPLEFKTDKDFDDRSFFDKFIDFQREPFSW